MQDPETNRPADAGCNSESAERRAFPGRPYDLLPIGHMAASLGGRLLRVNPNLAAMLGCAGEEELYRWCNGAAKNLFEESTDWNALVSLAETRGELVRFPAILRQRGGEILPCMVWARLSPWPWAGVKAVELVVQSMAERHQAFAALTQVLRLYRDMMALNPDPVLIHEQKRIMLANRAAEAFFGFSKPGALVGYAVEDLLDPRCLDAMNRHISAAASNLSAEDEFQMVLAGGAVRWLRNYSTRITFHGKPAILTLLHDRTERKKAEAALTQAERLHRTVVDTSPDPTFFQDNGLILYANAAFAQFLGLPEEGGELVGKRIRELLHPDTLPVLRDRQATILRCHGSTEAEYDVRLLSGEVRRVESRSVRADYEGRPAVLTVFRDLTERRLAEASLAQAERIHRLMAESAPDPTFFHEDGYLLHVNPATAAFMGAAAPEALVGRSLFELFRDDMVPLLRTRILEILETTGVSEAEYALHMPDGSEKFVLARSTRVEFEGRPAILSVLHDQTGRRRAEAALAETQRFYRILVDSLPEAVCLHDDGRILYANPCQRHLLAPGDASDLCGRHLTEFLHPDMLPLYERRRAAVLAGQEESMEAYPVRYADGRLVHVAEKTVPVEVGGRPAFLAIIRDITDRVEAEQARAEAEHLYRTIVENSPHPIAIHTPEGLLYGNPALARFYRRGSVEELLRTPLTELVDDETGARLVAKIRHMFEHNVGGEDVDTLRLRSGEVLHHQVSTEPIQYQGRRCLLSLLSDLTEHRLAEQARAEAEKLYRTIVETSPDPIFIYNLDGLLYANQAAASFYQVPSVAEFLRMGIDELVDEESAVRLKARIKALYEGTAYGRSIASVRLRSGEERHSLVSTVPIQYLGRPCLLTILHDLTGHRRTEAERDRALARYEGLFQSAPLGIALGLPGRRFVRVNQGMAAMYGYPSPEAMVAEVEDIAAGIFADPSDYWRLRRLVEYQETVRDFECLGRRRDGSRFWTSHSLRVVRDADGGLGGFEAFVRDTSAHRQAEAERDLALESYEDLFQSAPLGIVLFIPGRKSIRVNRRMAEIFGYPSPEAMVAEVGIDPTRLYVDPADHARLVRLAENQGEVKDFECLARRHNGEVFWASRCVRVVRGPGGVMEGYEAFVRDITARRQAEAERDGALESYEDLYQSAPLGIAVYVPGEGYTRVNRRMAELFGYPSPETLAREVGDDPSRLYANKADHARLRRLTRDRGEVRDFEYLALRRDGSTFWASRSVRMVPARGGEGAGYESFVGDITERRRAQQEAAERGRRVQVLAGELAMASERERRGMARELHDGPVQQLALATLLVEDLGRRLGSGKEFLPALDLLRDAAEQLRRVMDDLTPPALFSDSLAGTLACLGRDFFSRHGLKVDVSCPGLPGLSRDGVAFLCRAVRELLVNAIKHGRAGQARVLVDVRGASLWLTVMDNGKGFDPFPLDTGEPRSRGLPGLRSLCRDLGGGLAVESTPGLGTRVVLDLPLDPLCAAHPLV